MPDKELFGNSSSDSDEEIGFDYEQEPSNSVFNSSNNITQTDVVSETQVSPDPKRNGNGLLNEQINSLTAERDKLHKEVNRLETLSKSYKESLDKANAKVNQLSDSLMVIESKLTEKDQQISSYANIESEAHKHINALMKIAQSNKESFEKASKELQELRNSSNVSEEIKAQLETKTKELHDVQSSLTDLQNTNNSLEDNLNQINNELQSLQKNYDELSNNYSELENKYQDLQQAFDKLENEKVEASDSEVVTELQNEISELRLKLAESLTDKESALTKGLIGSERLRQIEETISKNRERYEGLEKSFKERENELIEKETEYKEQIRILEESLTAEKLEKSGLQSSLDSLEIDLKVAQDELVRERRVQEEVKNQLNVSNLNVEELQSKVNFFQQKLQDSLIESVTLKEHLQSFVSAPIFSNLNLNQNDLTGETFKIMNDVLQQETGDSKEQSEKLKAEISELETKVTSLEEQKTQLQNKVSSLTDELESVKNTQVKTSEPIDTASSQELHIAQLRIKELEELLEDARDKVKKKDERIKKYKEEDVESRNTIAELKKSLTELKKSKGDPNAVVNFTQEVFGMSPEKLFSKFNEFSVTLEVANYNLEAMKDFPQARAIVDKRVQDNKDSLAKILTKEYNYS